MHYLDPNRKTVKGIHCPKSPIPPQLRDFGRYPNTDEWLPGDILLFSDITPGIVGKTIVRVQEDCGYSGNDAMWQHAALYVGREHMCEAVFPRLRFHPIFDEITKKYIRVRRMPGLTIEQRHEIAIIGLTKLGSIYGWPELLQVLRERGRMWTCRNNINQRHFSRICSQHCANCYATATGTVLSTHAGMERATTPADISMTTQLEDVPVYWREIKSN